jgi:hypothetical protein
MAFNDPFADRDSSDIQGVSHKKGRRVQDTGRGDACGLALSA